MIHNAVGQLMKNNANKENNIRDLGLAYGLAALIYGTIGIFGAFGLLVSVYFYLRVNFQRIPLQF